MIKGKGFLHVSLTRQLSFGKQGQRSTEGLVGPLGASSRATLSSTWSRTHCRVLDSKEFRLGWIRLSQAGWDP